MTVPLESATTSPDPAATALATRYGARERFHVVYRVPEQATSRPESDPAGEVAVSDSTPADQAISLPTIPSGSALTPPATVKQREKAKRPKIRRTDHVARYRIAGELFYVEVKSRRTYLRHPRWSLMGAGRTLRDAEVALLDEARLVVRVFQKIPAAELDEEAERMLNFARRIA